MSSGLSQLKLSKPIPKSLYHSDKGLFPFQAIGAAQVYLREQVLAVWDTGVGKTHLGMASAALLFEDGLIDYVMVVCEANKVKEWLADFRKFTDIEADKYYGTVKKREKMRSALPPVFISTYETFKTDLAAKAKVRVGQSMVNRLLPKDLAEKLMDKRVLIIWDEAGKLANRKSDLYKVHDFFITQLRKAGAKPRILGLTATPIETSPENYYNLGRILDPDRVGTVASFERDHTLANGAKDDYGRYFGFKNLTPETTHEDWVTPLSTKMAPLIIRKRKTDPDVIEQFPKLQEQFKTIGLADKQQKFYEEVIEVFGGDDPGSDPGLFTVSRQIAAHPLSLLRAEGKLAQAIVAEVGRAGLEALGSGKTDELVDYLLKLKNQGAPAVVFSFFTKSIFEFIEPELRKEGITVVAHHGAMTGPQKEKAKEDFRAGRFDVFFTSDAGARGINLPEALYVIEYELALTHANRTQRGNRHHRIDSKHPSVTLMSFIAEHTIEEGIAEGVLKRNAWADQLLDEDDPGENFVTASDRRRLLQIARKTK